MTYEKLSEIKKAISFGMSDDDICENEDITLGQLNKIKEDMAHEGN